MTELREALVVWMDGVAGPRQAGYLASDLNGAVSFAYGEAYLAGGDPALSLSLPKAAASFGDQHTRAFFDNLLPENNQLMRVMERERLARDDIVGLLKHLGADCPGAISCLPIGAPPVKAPGYLRDDYELIPPDKMDLIVRSLANKEGLPTELRDPSPVAGVQRKVAVTQIGDGFAFPKAGSGAPTTHILKVPERGQGREARLEEAAAQLARAVGIDVSVPLATVFDGVEALLISRFDRSVTPEGLVIRLHQEDFAQALSLPAILKYERGGAPGRAFDVEAILSVLDRTGEPAFARHAFLRATIFNLCIGNTDNHAKNHGLIYDLLGTPHLAPLYDLQPTRLNKTVTHELSFNIGTANHIERIRADDFRLLFDAFGLSAAAQERFVHGVVVPMIQVLEIETRGLVSRRLKDFDDRIGFETELVLAALDVDLRIRERDMPPQRAGGWGASS